MNSEYTVDQFNADLAAPYAWPGGYPRYFITRDGAALSHDSAVQNAELIREAMASECDDGWEVIACEVNWESEIYCDHSGRLIESAYGQDSE